MGIDVIKSIPVYEDNQGVINSLQNWNHRRMKHIDLKYNFVKDLESSLGTEGKLSSDKVIEMLTSVAEKDTAVAFAAYRDKGNKKVHQNNRGKSGFVPLC